MHPIYGNQPQPPHDAPSAMKWNGRNAADLTSWAADSSGGTRFMFLPHLHDVNEAQVLLQYPGTFDNQGNQLELPQSMRWVLCPVGSTIWRVNPNDQDSPLRISYPPMEKKETPEEEKAA